MSKYKTLFGLSSINLSSLPYHTLLVTYHPSSNHFFFLLLKISHLANESDGGGGRWRGRLKLMYSPGWNVGRAVGGGMEGGMGGDET